MLNRLSRSWLLGGWLATVTVIVTCSVIMGASVSTSLLFFGLGLAPIVVMTMIGSGPPSPTIAEVLHSVDGKDGRR